MVDNREMPDSMKQFLDALREGLGEHGTPMSELYASSLKKFLELQISMMKSYQKRLDEELLKDSMSDMMNQMVKKFMSTYIDFVRCSREHRKKILEIQHDMVKSHVDIFEKYVNFINKKEDDGLEKN